MSEQNEFDGHTTAMAWKSIPGFPDYEASDEGDIRRSINSQKRGNVVPGRLLSVKIAPNGYIHTSVCQNGRERTISVHRLVAMAFLGPQQQMQVNHKDGNKKNNRVENLEWVTARDNYQHAIQSGLAPTGDRNGSRTKPGSRPRGDSSPTRKLTSGQVLQIRTLRTEGKTLAELGAQFGVTLNNIQSIVRKKTWAHI